MKKDIDVSYEDGQLTIKSKKSDKEESKDEDGKLLKDKAGNQLYEEHGDNIVEMAVHRTLPIFIDQSHVEERYDWFTQQWIDWLFTFKSVPEHVTHFLFIVSSYYVELYGHG